MSPGPSSLLIALVVSTIATGATGACSLFVPAVEIDGDEVGEGEGEDVGEGEGEDVGEGEGEDVGEGEGEGEEKAGDADCGNGVVDTRFDEDHCGECGNRCVDAGLPCGADAICEPVPAVGAEPGAPTGGVCTCGGGVGIQSLCATEGETFCRTDDVGGECFDLQSSPLHCGECSLACAGVDCLNPRCVDGGCQCDGRIDCARGQMLCAAPDDPDGLLPPVCVDPLNDDHCGECSNACNDDGLACNGKESCLADDAAATTNTSDRPGVFCGHQDAPCANQGCQESADDATRCGPCDDVFRCDVDGSEPGACDRATGLCT